MQETLDQLLEDFVLAGVPGCALTVLHHGKELYTGYRGKADLQTQTDISADTVYRVASCTKVVTAVAAMILYERGRLLLDDSVAHYLPCFRDLSYQVCDGSGEIIRHPATVSLTIRHLLTMTSGIPYAGKGTPTAVDYKEKLGDIYKLTNQQLAQRISEIPLEFNPGSHWKYGLGFDVLGAVIEVVCGMTLEEFFQKEIFQPLGMTDTTFFCTKELEKRKARTYRIHDGWTDITREPNITETNGGKLQSGGGGLVSTLHDLSVLAGMLAQGGIWNGRRILNSGTVELMGTNQLSGQPMEDFKLMSIQAYPWYRGYGWSFAGRSMVCCREAGSNGTIREFGWCGATGPYLLIDPQTELAVAYTMQTGPVIGGMQDYCHPRIRNTVYSLIDKL